MRRLLLGIWAFVETHPSLLGLGRRLARLLPSKTGWIRSGPGPLGTWTRHRDLPAPSTSFWDTWDGPWSDAPQTPEVRVRRRSSPPNAPPVPGRDAFFERLRQTQATLAPRPTSPSPVPDAPPLDDPVALFTTNAAALNAELHLESTPEAVRARVHALLDGHETISWSELPYGLQARSTEPATASAGLTGADAAIADTGALLLIAGPTHERTPSMLPPLHVAVLSRSQIHPSLADALAATDRSAASAVHLIAGPSRTADIELTLTLGVHGPGRLAIVIGP